MDNMLSEVRMNARLGNPPTPFYTNVPESANVVIKRAVNFKENEMSELCTELCKIIKQQREDVRAAILNRGPYKLDPSFINLQLTQEKWFSMSVKQRQAYQSKFDKASDESIPTAESIRESNLGCSLTISAEQADISTMPLQTVKAVFEKAKQLLTKENAIVKAPGRDVTAYLVESQTSKRPHYVHSEKMTGKVTGDNCPGWSSSKLCVHAVAVAERLCRLNLYIEWIKRHGERTNLTTLVTFDSCKAVGKKGNKPSTSRRKGGRTSSNEEPSVVLDRLNMHQRQLQSTQWQSVQAHQQQFPTWTYQQPLPAQQQLRTCTQQQQQQQLYSQDHHQHRFQQQQHQQTAPNYSIGYPNPQFGSYMVYLLQFCPPQVKTCFGCGQALKLNLAGK